MFPRGALETVDLRPAGTQYLQPDPPTEDWWGTGGSGRWGELSSRPGGDNVHSGTRCQGSWCLATAGAVPARRTGGPLSAAW